MKKAGRSLRLSVVALSLLCASRPDVFYYFCHRQAETSKFGVCRCFAAEWAKIKLTQVGKYEETS